jgi:EAL domain-containing protein (putative c-di-GMP-specific phosphodiesterase class I)
MQKDYGVDSMPETAENVATDYQVARADQDAFAARSQHRYGAAQARGFFEGEIAPLTLKDRKGDTVVSKDEHPRPDTTLEALQGLKPIVRADGHACIGFEALARWQSPRLGNVPPDEFIAIAEDSERILHLGDWVLRRALFEARRSGAEVPPRFSVNVSLRQLVWEGYFDSVQRALDETGWPADRLVLEVTESVLEDRASEFTLKVLKRLAQLGLHIHVDDFGAGYSSLSSLHRFPLHAIKIDRVFTQRLDFEACSVIEAAVLIARGHGLKVIAEGVETAEQAGILAGIGVDALQGYLFGRPQAGLPGAAGVASG